MSDSQAKGLLIWHVGFIFIGLLSGVTLSDVIRSSPIGRAVFGPPGYLMPPSVAAKPLPLTPPPSAAVDKAYPLVPLKEGYTALLGEVIQILTDLGNELGRNPELKFSPDDRRFADQLIALATREQELTRSARAAGLEKELAPVRELVVEGWQVLWEVAKPTSLTGNMPPRAKREWLSEKLTNLRIQRVGLAD